MRWLGQSDGQLVGDTLAGREGAFDELVRRHLRAAHAVALAYTGNHADAEDVTQEAFLKAYQALDRLSSPEAFVPWLVCIARNAALTQVRTAARRRDLLARNDPWPKTMESPVERRDRERALHEQVMALEDEQREVLLLHYHAGKPVREIAASLGISRAAAHKRLQRAREALSRNLVRSLEREDAGGGSEAERLRRILGAVASSQAPWLAAKGAAGAGVASQASGGGAGRLLLWGGREIMRNKLVAVALGLMVLALFAWKEGPAAWALWASRDSEPAPAVASEPSAAVTGAPVEATPAAPQAAAADAAADATSGPAGDAPKAALEPAGAPEPDKEIGSLSGRVITGQAYALSGARVVVDVCEDARGFSRVGTFSTVTDSEGRYSVEGIDAFGNLSVYAMAEGYETQKRGRMRMGPGGVLRGVDFTLPKALHTVSGVVASKGGDPLPGARIYLRHCGYSEEQPVVFITSSRDLVMAVAEEDGAFSISAPKAGYCDFTVEHRDYAPGFFTRVPTGTTDARFELEGGGIIEGRVTTPDGQPVPNRMVAAEGSAKAGGKGPDEDGVSLPGAPVVGSTDDAGAFSFARLSEAYVYQLSVLGPDPQGGNRGRRQVLAVSPPVRVEDGRTVKVDLVVHPLATLWGRAVDPETGGPSSPLGVYAHAADGLVLGAARVESDGSFRMRLPVDRSTKIGLRASYLHPSGQEPVDGGATLATVEIGPGEEGSVELKVPAPIAIPIRVVDEKGSPLPGLAIGLGQIDERGSRNYTWLHGGYTDASGRFTWGGLGPKDTYFAWVMRPGEDFWQSIAAESDPINASSGETVPEILLLVAERGGIEAILVDQSGAPLRSVNVLGTVTRSDGRQKRIDIRLDDQGHFVVRQALLPGSYAGAVIDTPLGQVSVGQTFEIESGMITNLGTLTLTPAGGQE